MGRLLVTLGNLFVVASVVGVLFYLFGPVDELPELVAELRAAPTGGRAFISVAAPAAPAQVVRAPQPAAAQPAQPAAQPEPVAARAEPVAAPPARAAAPAAAPAK